MLRYTLRIGQAAVGVAVMYLGVNSNRLRSGPEPRISTTAFIPRLTHCQSGSMTDNELKMRVLAVNTAALADADKEGIRVMDARLRPIRVRPKFVGVARTVQCFNDFLTVIKALGESSPGEVLVIDTQNSTRTVAGELFATESMRRGLAAIVLDGPCRDTEQLSHMDIPVFITGVRPISGTANKIYQTQVPVTCGGITVHPGDWVIGDSDGIVVCSREHLERILPSAENIVEAEDQLLRGMQNGISLLDQLNFDEHYAAVECGDESSKLQFKGTSTG